MFMPSGYAHVGSLDAELRANDVEWDVLGDDLYGAGEVSFSYTPSANGAAFEAGGIWVRLQVATQYSVDTLSVAALANRLGQLAVALDPSDAGGESLVSALEPLRAGALTAAMLRRVRDRLDLMLRDQQTAAALHFYVGEWLESLAMASRAAHQLSLPLEQLADPAVGRIGGAPVQSKPQHARSWRHAGGWPGSSGDSAGDPIARQRLV